MQRDRRLQQIVQLSRRMHEMAEAGDWGAVAGLEVERQGLIGDCFAQESPFQDTELAARQIGQIIDLDRRLIEISTAQKHQVGAALNKLQQARTAINAYEECPR